MDLEQAASRLRLPQRLLQAIEADDYSRLEHGVYLRGYLTSYARLVDLPEGEITLGVLQERQAPPPLIATGRISHSRWLYQRYSVPAVYLLLTGLIVGPSVWLATHGGLDRNLARLSTLDTTVTPSATGSGSTPVALPPQSLTQDPATTAVSGMDVGAVSPIEEPSSVPVATSQGKSLDQQPLMASLAPFSAADPKLPAAATSVAAVGDHSLHLILSEASWVEINADDGRKLEYAILPAGSEREYRSNSPLSVRIGNTTGAVVVLDGKRTDLAPYRRSNVAYFRAFGLKGDIAGAD
jgi:cytoskeleton protein RodZ